MAKKEVVRALIFLVILAGVIAYLTCAFSFPSGKEGDGIKERFNSFYEQPDNTIDGVYFGSSGVDRYWVGPQAYHDYGETVFTLSTGSQPLVFIKYLMKEVMKTQDTDLFIIDLRSAARTPDQVSDAFIRRVTDNMKLSKNRIEATEAVLEYAEKGDNKVDETDSSYYIPFLKYHSMWDGGISLDNLLHLNPSTDYMGYAAHTDVIYKSRTQKSSGFTSQMIPIDEETEKVLKDLLDYCDTLTQDSLFVVSPYPENKTLQGKLNYAINMAEERGYDTLNFNTPELYDAVGLDLNTDYYDNHHVNLVGALKYTDYLAQYLRQQYGLSDRRNNSQYENWEDSYKTYKEATAEGAELLRQRIEAKK